MHICHITSVHPRYDIRIFVKECRALVTHYQVSLVVADALGDEVKDGVAIYDVGQARGRWQRLYKTSMAIYRKVISLQPQVVHFHDPELILIGLLLQRRGIRVIYDVHEDVPKQVLNKYWLPIRLRPLIARLVTRLEGYAAAKFSGVICATELIAKRFSALNQRTAAIHNYPILAELAKSSQQEWSARKDRLCYIGSIAQTRGILPLIQSLVHSGLQLELAGPFSNESIQQLVQTAAGYRQVNYHGILDRRQIAQLLSEVKYGMVTLLPTPSYVESLPIKLFEYMLAGIPVIASDFPLWQPIVRGHNCGLMVDPSDPQAIANACLWLQAHPAEAQQMGENGYQAVVNCYSWEQEQHKLIIFYASLINLVG